MGWTCRGGGTHSFRPASAAHGVGPTTAEQLDACARWCEAEFPPVQATEGAWCCLWTPTPRGAICSWTAGLAVYEEIACMNDALLDSRAVVINQAAEYEVNPQRADAEARPASEDCAESLAYEACALPDDFGPAAEPCQPGSHRLALVRAHTAAECLQSCSVVDGCAHVAYSARYSTCELHSKCHRASGDDGDVWEWFSRLSPYERANQPPAPVTLGAPLGAAHGAGAGPRTVAPLGVKFDPTVPYKCDTSRGKHIVDAFKPSGDEPDTCSQICLPTAYWGAAQDRGVLRGSCADNGCSQFVEVRKWAGVAYSVYACDCPTTNGSALYSCPSEGDDLLRACSRHDAKMGKCKRAAPRNDPGDAETAASVTRQSHEPGPRARAQRATRTRSHRAVLRPI